MSKLNTQLLKGTLEGAMLLIISREELYGYVLNQRLQESGFDTVSDGTIYPALQKLQREGYIVGEMRKSPEGPARKYFKITAEGRIYLQLFIETWSRLKQNMEGLIDENQRRYWGK
ncbi:PadR family transcriptional regulator [Leuconostoc carnosum]|nr:PadR family transcriptional regulator [Leuconostoc carnosum]KAA8358164.1 PadR family transcriptional regulator [Leuconostoc carnosum]KAA8364662.1 PadR family transcriptional regulator [Leuconostoc carnosum]KAA8365535.1 PadR family transcriptional regulator [Leuconostoc carnosum]KAA8371564.1 PadR family transcriptional regulator [Leuconostoc carnosum]